MTDDSCYLPAASAPASRVVLGRCVRPGHVLLRTSSFHASAAAITFHTVGPAVSAHARRVSIAIIRGCTLDTAIAANHSVIAVLPAVRTTVSP
jgi:hypothetical protein